jgi:hypothetical protein
MRIRELFFASAAALILAASNAQAADVAYVLQTPGVT